MVGFKMFRFSFTSLLNHKRVNSKQVIFQDIEGYDDIKKLIMRCITLPEPTHVILDGPAASGKTMFLLSIEKVFDNAYFVDCTNATGSGMVDYLLSHDVKYLLLDEVEKMSKRDQNVLLNLMENRGVNIYQSKENISKDNERIGFCYNKQY